jgi:hypothetical protein
MQALLQQVAAAPRAAAPRRTGVRCAAAAPGKFLHKHGACR